MPLQERIEILEKDLVRERENRDRIQTDYNLLCQKVKYFIVLKHSLQNYWFLILIFSKMLGNYNKWRQNFKNENKNLKRVPNSKK